VGNGSTVDPSTPVSIFPPETFAPGATVISEFIALREDANYISRKRYGVVTSNFDPVHEQATKELNVGSVRLNFFWWELQPNPGSWANDVWQIRLDGLKRARNAGLEVLISLSGTPGWAAQCLPGTDLNMIAAVAACVPGEMSNWQDYVQEVLNRVHQELGSHDGIVYGIWNEPNLPEFLQDNSVAAEYGRLFEYANNARVGNHASARFAAPETSYHATSTMTDGYYYYDMAMAAIGHLLGPNDVVTVHWYPRPDAPPFSSYISFIAADAQGREIWLTETGEIGPDKCTDSVQDATLRSILQKFESFTPRNSRIFMYYLYDPLSECQALVRNSPTPYGPREAFYSYRDHLETRSGEAYTVSLRTATGHYLIAQNNGGGPIDATASEPGEWSRFLFGDVNDGQLEHGDYVKMLTFGGWFIAAGNGTFTADEPYSSPNPHVVRFQVERAAGAGVVADGDVIYLRTSGGGYVSAVGGGGGGTTVITGPPGPDEAMTFVIEESQ
jgi:hypothetical protein